MIGTVAKLPSRAEPFGHWLVLDCTGHYLAIPATSKRGWTVLERTLDVQQVGLGDRARIVFVGWRASCADRAYRLVRVDVLARALDLGAVA
jgi:hypothetical protein